MRKTTAAFGIAAAMTILPTTSAFADTHVRTTPAQQADTIDDEDDSDNTGLWGLLGLLGLAGLAGLKRRDRNDYTTTTTRAGGSTAVDR